MMTLLEFHEALDRWGADLEAWPEAAARRARARLAADPGAREALAAARRVDAHLSHLREHRAPPHLAARIVARAREADGGGDLLERLLGWFTARLWRPALMALVIGGAGYVTGMTVNEPDVDPALADDVMTLAFSDLYSELEDAQP